MEFLLNYALRFVGTPYIWGGKNPLVGLDCSGYVQLLLRSVGILSSTPFLCAQEIYDEFMDCEYKVLSQPQVGAIAFFGKSKTQIDHVAFCVDSKRILEARGGDQTTLTVAVAIKQSALVEMRPISHRQDLVALVLPDYSSVSLA